jgi:hypothetical protein
LNGFEFLHAPTALRGSVGIHPCCKPSWYDQAGASTFPLTEELPIFQVQKNQFYWKKNTCQLIERFGGLVRARTCKASMLASANTLISFFVWAE